MRDTDAYGQWEMEAARRREVIAADRPVRDVAREVRSTAGETILSTFAIRARAALGIAESRPSQPACDQRRPTVSPGR